MCELDKPVRNYTKHDLIIWFFIQQFTIAIYSLKAVLNESTTYTKLKVKGASPILIANTNVDLAVIIR